MAGQRRNGTFFKCFILSVVVGFGVCVTSCQDKDDYMFNYEYVKQLYEQTFPVKNIDPSQDWKTTNVVDVHVSVQLEYGEIYKVAIYTANPLNDKNAHVLGKGQIANGENFSIKVNSPKDRATLFISCKDSKNKLLVQQFKVNNDGTVNAVFGSSVARSRNVANRSLDGISDGVSLEDYALGNLDDIRKEEYKYTEDVLSTPEFATMDYIWIPKEETVVAKGNLLISLANKVLLIDGNLEIGADCQIPVGLRVVVAGKLIANHVQSLSIGKQKSKIIVLKDGEVDITIVDGRALAGLLQDGDDLPIIYNAGTLKLNFGLAFQEASNRPAIYNCGSAIIDLVDADIRLVNFGDFMVSQNANLNEVRNYCHLTVGGDLEVQHAVVGDRARLDVSGSLKPAGSLTLGDNAIVDIASYVARNSTNVVGPTSNASPAVLKMNTFSVSKPVGFQGVVYVSEAEKGSGDGYDETCTNIEYLLPVYNAGITIESSGCNGVGFKAEEVVEPDPDPTDPQKYTYCYEDYYPTPGDYDFNDVVMDVTYNPVKDNDNTVNKLTVNVTLSAVGANYQLGGALQLVGIPQNSVSSITVSNTSFNDNARKLFDQNWETETQTGGKGIVVPLFNDAHYVLTGQNNNRYLFNTSRGHEGYSDATPRTMTIEVTFNEGMVDDITLDNLDLFIARPTISENGYYENQQGRTRIEIHLYQFWDYVTNNSVVFADNIAAAGNRTWGVCVPNFRYPYETISIKEAYPGFESWAQNRSSNTDWYNYPDNSKVYR